MRSKVLFCISILFLIFGIFLLDTNSSAQYITDSLMSGLYLGPNELVSSQSYNALYSMGQNLFSDFGASSYGSNNFGFTNNLFKFNRKYNSYTPIKNYGAFTLNQLSDLYNIINMNLFNTSYNIYGPQSYNISNFNPQNNSFMPGPINNINIIQDWQYMIPLKLVTHRQAADVNSAGGQTGSNIAQPTTRGKILAALTPVTNCDDLLTQLKEDAIQKMEAKIDLNIEKVISCEGCCHDYFYPYYGYSTSTWFNHNPAYYQTYSASGAWNGGNADSASPVKSASEYSTTNVQVAGVDEADFIKNDGSYIYILANDKFQIINAWPPEDANIISTVDIEGIPKKLFVANDRALIYSSLDYIDGWASDKECTYGYNCDFTGDNRKLKISIFDISDRTNPFIVREIRFGGSYINSRRVGTSVHTVIFSPAFFSPEIKYWPELYEKCKGYYYPWWYEVCYYDGNNYDGNNYNFDEPTLEELLAAFDQLKEENRAIIENSTIADWIPGIQDTIYSDNGEVVNDRLLYDCTDFYESDTPDNKSFLTIASMDIDLTDELNHVTIFGHPGAVYASPSALYISSRQHYNSGCKWFYDKSSGIQEASTVHKFRLQNESPAGCEYAGSGVVKGRVLNQFSMDEYDNYLRIATTTNRVPSPNVHSTLSIFEECSDELRIVGQVDHIAPKEDIRSVRFDGERGFIVTFKKTDPLFAFDLSDPTAPNIAGELKIPGYSTYIHLMDQDHLLTIGYDSEDHVSFAWFQGIMLQIFDVSNMSEPALLHKWVIGTRGSTSDAATNHLAFNYFPPKNLLAIPITVCEGGAGGGSYGTEMTFSGLIVYDVSLENGFSEHGRVSHLDPCSNDCRGMCSNWWTNSNSVVKRSIFMDDYVYSVAMDQIIVNDLNNMGQDIRVIDFP